MNNGTNQQIIKTRDDPGPVILEQEQGKERPSFMLKKYSICSWAKSGDEITSEKLRERIEPWLTALFQSEHLSLLVGSGLTTAVHFLATEEPANSMSKQEFEVFKDEIDKSVMDSAEKARRGNGNFEDQIRVVNELLAGLNILVSTKPDEKMEKAIKQWRQNHLDLEEDLKSLQHELETALKNFADSILKGEKDLISAAEKQEESLNYLVSFLMSFASRTGTRDRLNIFTTNYDRYIELGADIAGLRLIDRFVGTISPIFRASRMDIDYHYNPPGIRGEPRYVEGVARYTKLHGSIDWIYSNGEIKRIGLPFGSNDIIPYLQSCELEKSSAMQLMIYPNPAKDMDTLFYPYSELFRDFAAAICRPNSTLVFYGYGFGDEHINRIIKDMLTIPSTHLVIISYSDPNDRIIKTYEKLGRNAQITLLLGNHLGDLKALVDHYLPKPAIDRTTIRMANLIKARLGAQEQTDQKQAPQTQTYENNVQEYYHEPDTF
jgi:hypothetical protein